MAVAFSQISRGALTPGVWSWANSSDLPPTVPRMDAVSSEPQNCLIAAALAAALAIAHGGAVPAVGAQAPVVRVERID